MTYLRRSGSWSAYLMLLAALLVPDPADAQTKLLRFPDIQGDRVVFSYAGDIWVAPAAQAA